MFQSTPVGIFRITEVESVITEQLTPLEKLCLSLAKKFEYLTRLEVHCLSGVSINISTENLENLHTHGMLELVDYNEIKLKENVKTLIDEIGEDWFTPQINRIASRKYIKQYKITNKGTNALNSQSKLIQSPIDINLIITANPFHLFNQKIELRHNGYEDISMTPELTDQILKLAKKYEKEIGIDPKYIGSNSISEGKEVTTAFFWISVNHDTISKPSNAGYQVYITSNSFGKWVKPSWNSSLNQLLPKYEMVENLIGSAISEHFDMVEEVVIEGLELGIDRMIWLLKCDLEMLLLINNSNPEPIQEIKTEISLPIPNLMWKVVFIMQLDTQDDLANKALTAARFHSRASKRGFNFDSGYKTWSNMMNNWDRSVSQKEYSDILNMLVKYDCLTEVLPNIEQVYIDLDNLMSHQRRGRQQWEFSRIRQLTSILGKANINDVFFIASDEFIDKIDEDHIAQEWIDKGKIEIHDYQFKIHPAIQQAAENNGFYLGNRKIPQGDEFKDIRIYSRKLKFFINRGTLKIPGLEPFYERKVKNVLSIMYDEYYE